METKKLDYSVLEQLPKTNSIVIIDVENKLALYIVPPFVAVTVVVGLSISFGVYISLFFSALTAVTVAGVTILVSKYVKKQQNTTDTILNNFSSANNFSYLAQNKTIDERGSLFQSGGSKKETRVLTGTYMNLPFKLSNFHYETGSGKSRYYYDIRVARFTLPRQLPHMVIDCLVEDGENGQSVLPITFDKSQELQLEGDFYKYFMLYAPDTYAVSALTILAPDAMEALLKMKSFCDIEIIDKYIYFYFPEHELTKERYQSLFQTISEVMSKIDDKLTKDDIFSNATQAQISASPSSSPILLKKRHFGWLHAIGVVIIIGSFYTFSVGQDTVGALIFQALFWFYVVISIALEVWFAIKRNQLRKQLVQRYSR